MKHLSHARKRLTLSKEKSMPSSFPGYWRTLPPTNRTFPPFPGPQPNQTVCLGFAHLRKAGGRSFVGTFSLPHQPVFWAVSKKFPKPLFDTSSRSSKVPRIISTQGHRSWAEIRAALKGKTCRNALQRWVIFLRHPVPKLISFFNTCIGREKVCLSELLGLQPQEFPHEHVKDINDFAQVIKTQLYDKVCRQHRMNIYTAFLLDRVNPEQSARKKLIEFADDESLDFVDKAIRNLDKFHFVGLQERYKEGLTLMSDLFSLDLDSYLSIFNYNPKPVEATEESKDIFAQCLQPDIKVYEAAVERFEFDLRASTAWRAGAHCPSPQHAADSFQCEKPRCFWGRNAGATSAKSNCRMMQFASTYPMEETVRQDIREWDCQEGISRSYFLCGSLGGCRRKEKDFKCG
eukprot:m.184249 g.184249  ORF g.184249 m.184249 type:complete len:403 (-) comp25532_c2_seq8:25-1233(-)